MKFHANFLTYMNKFKCEDIILLKIIFSVATKWQLFIYFFFFYWKIIYSYIYIFPGGPLVLGIVGIPIIVILAIVVIINIIQAKNRKLLPKFLQTWDWLPKPMHSLQPYDACCLSLPCCKSCREAQNEELSQVEVTKNSVDNHAFENTDTKFW